MVTSLTLRLNSCPCYAPPGTSHNLSIYYLFQWLVCLFIYLFIGCVGSLLLHAGFL